MGPYGRDVEFAVAVLLVAGVCLICAIVAEHIMERNGD